jgi:hypothetical protein
MSVVELGRMSEVELGRMSEFELGRMSGVELGRMSENYLRLHLRLCYRPFYPLSSHFVERLALHCVLAPAGEVLLPTKSLQI